MQQKSSRIAYTAAILIGLMVCFSAQGVFAYFSGGNSSDGQGLSGSAYNGGSPAASTNSSSNSGGRPEGPGTQNNSGYGSGGTSPSSSTGGGGGNSCSGCNSTSNNGGRPEGPGTQNNSGYGSGSNSAVQAAQQKAAQTAQYASDLANYGAARAQAEAITRNFSVSQIKDAIDAANRDVINNTKFNGGTSLGTAEAFSRALSNLSKTPTFNSDAARQAQAVGERIAEQTGMKDVDPDTPGLQVDDPIDGRVTILGIDTLPPDQPPADVPDIESPFDVPPGYTGSYLGEIDVVQPGFYAPKVDYTQQELERIARMAYAEVGVLQSDDAYRRAIEAAVNNAIINGTSINDEITAPNRYQAERDGTIDTAPLKQDIVDIAKNVLDGTEPRVGVDQFGNLQYNFANVSLTNDQVVTGVTKQSTADAWNKVKADPNSTTVVRGPYETTFGNLGGLPADGLISRYDGITMSDVLNGNVSVTGVAGALSNTTVVSRTNPSVSGSNDSPSQNGPYDNGGGPGTSFDKKNEVVDLTGGVEPVYGVKEGEIPRPVSGQDVFVNAVKNNPNITVEGDAKLEKVSRETLWQIDNAARITGQKMTITEGFDHAGHVSHDKVGFDAKTGTYTVGETGSAIDVKLDNTAPTVRVEVAKVLSALGATNISLYTNTPGLMHVDNLTRVTKTGQPLSLTGNWSWTSGNSYYNYPAGSVEKDFADNHIKGNYAGYKGIGTNDVDLNQIASADRPTEPGPTKTTDTTSTGDPEKPSGDQTVKDPPPTQNPSSVWSISGVQKLVADTTATAKKYVQTKIDSCGVGCKIRIGLQAFFGGSGTTRTLTVGEGGGGDRILILQNFNSDRSYGVIPDTVATSTSTTKTKTWIEALLERWGVSRE